MDSPGVTDWVTAIGAIIAAGAAIVTAYIAWKASMAWKESLQNQRFDECVAAAVALRGSVNRCISSVKGNRQSEIWPNYSAAWDNQTKFRSAFQVARRYRPQGLAGDVPERIDEILNQLNPICAAVARGGSPDEAALKHIASVITSEVNSVQGQLGQNTA